MCKWSSTCIWPRTLPRYTISSSTWFVRGRLRQSLCYCLSLDKPESWRRVQVAEHSRTVHVCSSQRNFSFRVVVSSPCGSLDIGMQLSNREYDERCSPSRSSIVPHGGLCLCHTGFGRMLHVLDGSVNCVCGFSFSVAGIHPNVAKYWLA